MKKRIAKRRDEITRTLPGGGAYFGKKEEKFYMTGCGTGIYVHWRCNTCGSEGRGIYGRPPKTCKNCGERLFWEENYGDRTSWVEQ